MSVPIYEDYLSWHTEKLGDELNNPDLALRYQANVTLLKSAVETHEFLSNLSKRLSALAINGVFQSDQKTPDLTLSLKPYDSVISKIYRINCLWNKSWPDEPQRGWVDYAKSYSEIDDLVRTTLVCRYLDGPEMVAREIAGAAEECGLKAYSSPRATDTGYYGWHVYVRMPHSILIGDRGVEIEAITEFQITTQLQSVLRELTHKFYEESRITPAIARTKSRWDFRSPRFRSEYLGHTLHLVDAMILELRDDPARKGSSNSSEIEGKDSI